MQIDNFAWTVKSCFLGKKVEKYFSMTIAENFTQRANLSLCKNKKSLCNVRRLRSGYAPAQCDQVILHCSI